MWKAVALLSLSTVPYLFPITSCHLRSFHKHDIVQSELMWGSDPDHMAVGQLAHIPAHCYPLAIQCSTLHKSSWFSLPSHGILSAVQMLRKRRSACCWWCHKVNQQSYHPASLQLSKNDMSSASQALHCLMLVDGLTRNKKEILLAIWKRSHIEQTHGLFHVGVPSHLLLWDPKVFQNDHVVVVIGARFGRSCLAEFYWQNCQSCWEGVAHCCGFGRTGKNTVCQAPRNQDLRKVYSRLEALWKIAQGL